MASAKSIAEKTGGSVSTAAVPGPPGAPRPRGLRGINEGPSTTLRRLCTVMMSTAPSLISHHAAFAFSVVNRPCAVVSCGRLTARPGGLWPGQLTKYADGVGDVGGSCFVPPAGGGGL